MAVQTNLVVAVSVALGADEGGQLLGLLLSLIPPKSLTLYLSNVITFFPMTIYM
jgi:hypothetical protein